MFDFFSSNKKYKTLTHKQAKERLDSGDKLYLLDVRTPEEYKEGHIPNSISIPLAVLKGNIKKITNNPNDEILIYCLSGRRAISACEELTALGYTNVSTMGGINGWPYGVTK